MASGSIHLSQLRVRGDETYWLESRPAEDRRQVLVRHRAGLSVDFTPSTFDVRSRVHEYGGGDYVITPFAIYATRNHDQMLYRCDGAGHPPVQVTRSANVRFADGVYAPGPAIITVCEDHSTKPNPENYLARIDLVTGAVVRLVSDADFVAWPRLSPDGRTLAWVSWNRPHMPWDRTELWIGALDRGVVRERRRIAGGGAESVCQPEWSPAGILHYVSDRHGWWNIYCWRDESIRCVLETPADCGEPLWSLGSATYGFVSDAIIICRYAERGIWRAAIVGPNGRPQPIRLPYSAITDLRAGIGRAVVIASAPGTPEAVLEIDPHTGRHTILSSTGADAVENRYVSVPEHIEFETTGGDTAYAFFYAPRNDDVATPADERPPLVVKVHGGPTGAATTARNLNTQFWTSRGFGVADVNYRGSSGYGRGYRNRLREQWGVMDVDDVVSAAQWLSTLGLVDGNRLAIRGKSAGGFTALCAVAFRRVFQGATSVYGVSDLEELLDTHKFEACYTLWLIGPYPQARERYRERSPLFAAHDMTAPVLLFQGKRDTVIRMNQAERLAAALRKANKPVHTVLFDDEGHGFRRESTVEQALDAELAFVAVTVAKTAAPP